MGYYSLFSSSATCTSVHLVIILSALTCRVTSRPSESSQNDPQLLHFDVRNDKSVGLFGNDQVVDFYRLLEVEGSHLIVGAADNVYNLTIRRTEDRIQIVNSSHYYWPATPEVAQECRRKAASSDDCKNFVRVLSINSRTGDLLICGTNAYKPKCRIFDPRTRQHKREFSGTGLSPLDPRHNTSFYLDRDNLYAATVSDFSGSDSLIYRKNVSENTGQGIRTERNNIRLLNKPQFAGSLHSDKYVYFFFREKSVEAESVDGIGQAGYYSRVARVCKNDRGGPSYYANEWTSFVKARLNCSLPGPKPFYFDQIVSVSNVTGSSGFSKDPGGIVYATFVSEYDFLQQSVVCAFNLSSIDALFEKSDFLVSDPGNPAYYRKRREHNSESGKCQSNSRNLSAAKVQSLKSTPLMADLVPNIFSRPVGVYESGDHYNQIAVLPNVHLPEHDHRVDVLFVGTDQGNVLKLVNLHGRSAANDKDPMVKISVTKVGDSPIRRLIIFNEQYLIALTDRKVMALPLQQCSKMLSCKQCVEARDPHCGWHTADKTCRGISRSDTTKIFIQDVYGGDASSCRGFEKVEPQLVVVAEKKVVDGSRNDSRPVQGFRKFPVGDCDCAKKTEDEECDCPGQGLAKNIQAVRADPESDDSIVTTTTVVATLAVLQLLIIIALVYGFYRYKNKQKKLSKKKADQGVIHAYGDPNNSFHTDTLRHSNPLPPGYYVAENYSPPMTSLSNPQPSQYEPFYPITQVNIDHGYQSGSLGSNSGSEVVSRLEGSSEPSRYFSTFSGGSSTASTSHPGTP